MSAPPPPPPPPAAASLPSPPPFQTRVLKVKGDPSSPQYGGRFLPPLPLGPGATSASSSSSSPLLSALDRYDLSSASAEFLGPVREAAALLRASDVPVAFPTETVYGLGADATRAAAVRGIYAAKRRPADNPLIVHVCDLRMLRALLRGREEGEEDGTLLEGGGKEDADADADPIPLIYRPLIRRFWPGPLTILLPLPPTPPPSSSSSSSSHSSSPSRTLTLAPEVTAGLSTFGARMPASPLALSLIAAAGVPLAAPSANASTRPSPTAAQHVVEDLGGRIALVLDGGACAVGVESTVVDGLCDPPVVLRPGGVGIEELRAVHGWEGVQRAYKDASEEGAGAGRKGAPRAPGMKYKHYSPRARVVLYESGKAGGRGGVEERGLSKEDVQAVLGVEGEVVVNGSGVANGHGAGNGTNGVVPGKTVGVIRTGRWKLAGGLEVQSVHELERPVDHGDREDTDDVGTTSKIQEGFIYGGYGRPAVKVLDIDLGIQIRGIAQGLFAALRDLDSSGADTIFVEGIPDDIDIAAAVMNRLRKAASEIRT